MDEEALIAAVYKRDSLWDPSNEHHRNSVVLKKMWEEVAEDLNCNVKYVKGKWKNIRAYFFKELKKTSKPQCSKNTDESGTSSWRLFNMLFFLRDTIPNSAHDDFTIITDNENKLNAIEVSLPCDELEPERKRIRGTPINPQKYEQTVELDYKNYGLNERCNEKDRSDDHHFFQSLLPFMVNIPSIRKLRLRNKIQALILSELESIQDEE